jgi:hypothetical protein
LAEAAEKAKGPPGADAGGPGLNPGNFCLVSGDLRRHVCHVMKMVAVMTMQLHAVLSVPLP